MEESAEFATGEVLLDDDVLEMGVCCVLASILILPKLCRGEEVRDAAGDAATDEEAVEDAPLAVRERIGEGDECR